MAKLARSKREKPATKAKPSARKPERSLTLRSKTAEPAKVGKSEPAGNKKISQKFLEVMEKRKASAEKATPGGGGWGARRNAFGRPPARRGRRPKGSVEYTPSNNEEEGYGLESEYERIEYDTGIRAESKGGDDTGFNLDRFDDFDEELNFDR